MLVTAPVILVAVGCAHSRLPAIDPSGRRIFLPKESYTTVAPNSPVSHFSIHRVGHKLGLKHHRAGVPLPGPYQPAGLGRHRCCTTGICACMNQLGAKVFGHFRFRCLGGSRRCGLCRSCRLCRVDNTTFGPSVTPPLCGPNGLAPDGSPCYPIGSPSPSSLAATLPGSPNSLGVPNSSLANAGMASGGCNNPYGAAGQNFDPGYATNAADMSQQLSTRQVGLTRFAQLGPGVVLARQRFVARVGQEVVVVGGVQSTSGVTRVGEPVQWTLANNSAGTIVDAARPNAPRHPRLLGFLHHAKASRSVGIRGCGNSVQSITADRCAVLPRNPMDPTDDIYLNRGQTWVSLTSGSEGTSYVTLSAPQLPGRRAATAIVEWIDATWDCPKPVTSSLEGPGRLVTNVCRNSNRVARAGWIVRYSYLDGPKAGLRAPANPSSESQSVDVPTDVDGRATVDVFPLGTESGTTRIRVQLFDPRNTNVQIGECVGFVTWCEGAVVGRLDDLPPSSRPPPPASQSPTTTFPPSFPPTYPPARDPGPVTVPGGSFNDAPVGQSPFTTPPATSQPPFNPQTPPQTAPQAPPQTPPQTAPQRATLAISPPQGPPAAAVGEEVNYSIEVRNTSQATAVDVIVSTTVPAGMQLRGSKPVRAETDGRNVAWRLGNIPPDRSIAFQVIYQTTEMTSAEHVFYAVAQNATEVNSNIRTEVSGRAIELEVNSPNPPRVGETVQYAIRAINRTNRPLRNVDIVVDQWTPGLIPEVPPGQPPASPERGIADSIAVIPPGGANPINLRFRAFAAGAQRFRVSAIEKATQATATVTPTLTVLDPPPQPVGEPSLEIAINGPQRLRAGATGEIYQISFRNNGQIPLDNLRVVVSTTPGLVAANATPGFQLNPDKSLVWQVQRLEREFGNTVEVQCQVPPNPAQNRGQLRVRVESDQGFGEQTFDVSFDESFGVSGLDRTTAQRPVGDLAVAPTTDTLTAKIESRPLAVRVGEPLEFLLTVMNDNPEGYRDLQVSMEIADGMEFTGYSGPPQTNTELSDNGLMMDFSSVREILPRERLTFRVKTTASKKGTARIIGRVQAVGMVKPLIVASEATVN